MKLDESRQRLLNKAIAAEVSYRLRTGQDISLGEISKAVRSRYRYIDEVDVLRPAFRKAAEEALRRKSHS